jgi:DNA-binding response OmpR family regulator
VRRFAALEIDAAGREVRVDGRPIELTRTEFDLLDTLSAEPHVVFSRRQLLDHVWGGDWYGDDHVIDVHVGNLRRKLHDDAIRPRYIRTVRGVGYRMGPGR